LSKPILTGLLRKKLGFDGLIVTDALTMEGVREMFGDERVPIEAIKAGADVLLMPPDLDLAYNAVLEAVEDGEIGEGRINKSVHRILSLKLKQGLFENPYVDVDEVSSRVGTPQHLAVADEITNKTVTLVKNDDGLLPLQPGPRDVLVTGLGSVDDADSGRRHCRARGDHRGVTRPAILLPRPSDRRPPPRPQPRIWSWCPLKGRGRAPNNRD
jgi:beta-N-acetylhexosaminidase